MKIKYYKVLTENEHQKLQIQELSNQSIDREIALKTLKEEKEKCQNELVQMKVQLSKQSEEMEEQRRSLSDLKSVCKTKRTFSQMSEMVLWKLEY